MVHVPGRSVLPISIGGIPLSLVFSEQKLREKAEARYASFQEASEEGFPIHLNAAISPGTIPWFDYTLNGATLRLGTAAADMDNVGNEYTLDSLLRILLSLKLLPERGFLLHAATITHQGASYVFMGRSGAGKSTIASHAPAGAALTDEISLVRSVNGVWHAHGTPFWGEFRAGGQNLGYPLAGIYALVQAEENHVAPLSPRAALRELLANVLFFSSERAHREQLLRITSEIVAELPIYCLQFTRDISFWEALAA